MTWWERNNLRLIQHNLRECDANLDVDGLIDELKQFSANVLMMNAGGIFAFYPTKLQYHYRTPHQHKDLLGEAVAKAHVAGMRFIARFDFSKAHESIFQKKPEWFYRTKEGLAVNYGGIVHTCLNGWYQQHYALQMIEEVITAYPVDGIFFNMFGYIRTDYSGNDYGICYCGNCSSRFQEMTGLSLAVVEQSAEAKSLYRRFQAATTRDILDRIQTMVKNHSPEIAISTYAEHAVDIVRKESNTKLTRPHPKWLYSASENVKSVMDSWDGKLVSNCSINAVDLQYRFMGVSRHETAIRLFENIASGSGLDFCIIGVFDGYPDRANLETVKDIYRFHHEYEQHFAELKSVAAIALIKPSYGSETEYLGIFKILKEQHLMFDVIVQSRLPHKKEALKSKVKLMILPHAINMEQDELAALIELQKSGVTIVATGQSLTDGDGEEALQQLFQAKWVGGIDQTDAAYIEVNDKQLFPSFIGRDWVFVDRKFSYMSFADDTEVQLPFISPSSFGPPERAYGHERSGYYGVGIARHHAGWGIYFPWQIGTAYYEHGFEEHKWLLTDVINHITGDSCLVQTDAPGSVELFVNETGNGAILVQLLNMSGFNGVTYSDPVPIGPIHVHLRGIRKPVQVSTLKEKKEVGWVMDETLSIITVKLDTLQVYEAIVLELIEERGR